MARKSRDLKVVRSSASNNKKSAASALAGIAAGATATFAVFRSRRTVDLSAQDKPKVDAFDPAAAGITTPKQEKGIKGKALKLAERRGWRWIGRVMQVQQRYGELNGSNIAAAVTLQIFLSVFPLFLVAAAIIGFVAHGNPGEVADSVIRRLGLTDPDMANAAREAVTTASKSKNATSIVGLLTLAWSALGVTSALQFAYNQAWQTSGRGVKDKAVGVVWLAGAGFLFAATAVMTALLNFLPAGLGLIAVVVGLAVSFGLWMFTGRVLPNVEIPWKSLIPGAIVGVVGLELLKLAGSLWVPRAIDSSSAVYGALGILFAILAWMLLFGKLVMYCAVINVVAYEARYGTRMETIKMPRATADAADEVTRSGNADK